MDDPTVIAVLAYAAIVTAGLAWPRSREKMRTWLRAMYEMPLRLATGRRRPDPARIAQLERELRDA